MKYIKILILVLVIVSCEDDFLNPDPVSSIQESDFFQNDEEVLSGVISMYDAIQGENFLNEDFDTESSSAGIQYEYYLTEMRTDNTQMRDPEGAPGEFNNWQVSSSNIIVTNYYKSFYEIIYRANRVLEFVSNANEENQASYIAEAKFVRAYAYFNLVRLFGDVPLITSISETDEFTRVSKNIIYSQIEEDLLEANSVLDNSYKSRASSGAAKTLLAKVYLTLERYTEAKLLCNQIIASEVFQLEDNFRDIFHNELNDEIIFSIGYISDSSEESQGFSAEWIGNTTTRGTNYLTDNMVDAFGEDLGYDRAIYSQRAVGSNNQVVKYLAQDGEGLEIQQTAFDPNQAGNDWVILRYADVYLMFVESVLEDKDILGVTPTNTIEEVQKAKELFTAIRQRAGEENFVAETITKDDLLNERRLEFAFENQRFFDLVRFGVAEEVLIDYALEEGFSFINNYLLLPIPDREITLSNGLMSQNPGY